MLHFAIFQQVKLVLWILHVVILWFAMTMKQLDYELSWDFYEVIVAEAESRINYQLMEIERG